MRVSDPEGASQSPPDAYRHRERSTFLRTSGWVGLLVLAIGLFQIGWAARDLLPLGTAHDPRTALQLRLLLDQGVLSAFSGGVLSIGGFYINRAEQRAGATGGLGRTDPETGWHRTLLAVAVLLIVGVVVLSVLPTPARSIAFASDDFRSLAQPTNVTSDGWYLVSRKFWGDQGSVLTVSVQIAWTNNSTGAVLFGGAPGNFEVYAASESTPRESPTIASTFVVPSDGFYVLVVWLGRCPTPSTGECANNRAAVQARVLGTVPTIYLPAQIGGSVFGPVLVAVSAFGWRARGQIRPG